jgi:hypothetical protein
MIMNLKKLATGVAIAATVVSGTIAMTAPAEAGTLSFTGAARLKNAGVAVGGQSAFDFFAYNGGIGSLTLGTGAGNVQSPPSDPVFGVGPLVLKDLLLTKTGATSWVLASSPIGSFITGLAGGVTYELTQFNLSKVGTGYSADLSGIFQGGAFDGIEGLGTITAQANLVKANGSSFSGDITPVPTPALLPGLLGLGITALRKRKGEGSEAEKEAVGVKA